MKRTGTGLLCLLLLSLLGRPALAVERFSLVDIQAQAQQGWHQTYQAHGRRIRVDVPIDVPEGLRFPALRALPQPPSALVPLTQPKDSFGFFDGEHTFRNHLGWLQRIVGNQEEQHRASIRMSKNRPQAGFEGRRLHPPDIDWDTAYAYNNPATVRGLYDKAMAMWQQHFPAQALSLRLAELWAGTAYRAIDVSIPDFVGPPIETPFNAFLVPKFEQLAGGIPLLVYAQESFLRFGGFIEGYRPQPMGNQAPGLWIHARNLLEECGMAEPQEIVDFFTLQIGETLQDDLPLCSVGQAMAAYEQLILAGQLRHVHKLRLGYAIWEDRDRPGQYLLLPSWVAWGVMVRQPGKEAWFDSRFSSLAESSFWQSNEYGPILVNAQTGQLIDPWRRDADRAQDAPRLIMWE